jgi:dethiobiotin synthetase
MQHNPLFVTGIGTDIGKTLISAILVEKLKCDYWKPVQAGELDNSDTMKSTTAGIKYRFRVPSRNLSLTQPYSPHKSAALDGIEIDEKTIIAQKTNNHL